METPRGTEAIVEAVQKHPERRRLTTLESALSLPVPTWEGERPGLAFFWYPVGGPAMNRTVRAPTVRVRARGVSEGEIDYARIEPGELDGRTPGEPLGSPRITRGGTREELADLRGALHRAVDGLRACDLRPPSTLTGAEREAAAAYAELFGRLAVIVLVPCYRALSPRFFDWLDAATG